MSDPSTRTRRPPPKNTLFCPSCDHAAPADGDWLHDERVGGEAIQCPDCETVVTVRRTRSAMPA